MVCNTCGRSTQNEAANFCEYCGSSFREQTQGAFHIEPQMQQAAVQNRPDTAEKTISFASWIGIYGILLGSLFIPIIGIFCPLGILAYLSFSKKIQDSKKNWAKATLIFVIFYYIIAIGMLVLFSNPTFSKYMNGAFNLSNLYQGIGAK